MPNIPELFANLEQACKSGQPDRAVAISRELADAPCPVSQLVFFILRTVYKGLGEAHVQAARTFYSEISQKTDRQSALWTIHRILLSTNKVHAAIGGVDLARLRKQILYEFADELAPLQIARRACFIKRVGQFCVQHPEEYSLMTGF